MTDVLSPAPSADAVSSPAPSEAASAPTPAPDSAPAAAAADSAPPAVETLQAPAAAVAPAPEAAPLEAPKSAEPAPQLEKSLLSEEPAKPEEAKPQPAPEPQPEPAPVYEAFKLPEGVTVDPERLKAFTDVLGANKGSQEFGQNLVELHMAELNKAQEAWRTEQFKAWNDAQVAWKEQVKADPEIGGSRFETTLQSAKSVIAQYAGTPEEQTALIQALEVTGAGNHPEIIRFLSRIGAAVKESAPAPASQPTATPDRASRRYPTMSSPS